MHVNVLPFFLILVVSFSAAVLGSTFLGPSEWSLSYMGSYKLTVTWLPVFQFPAA
jgi:hypothetical protein